MAKKNVNNRKTAARMVMDVMLKQDACSPEHAIPVESFKDLKLTTAVIGYTIGNLINDDVVIKTGDDRYYFNEIGWKKLQKKVNRGYLILLGLPVLVLLIMVVLRYLFQV